LEDRLTPEQLHQLQMKHRSIEEQSNQLVESLRRGGKQAVQGKSKSSLIFQKKNISSLI